MFKCFNRDFSFSEQEQLPPSDVKEAFSKFANGGSAMSADQLRQFLLEHQHEPDCTEDDSNRIVENAMQSRKSDDAGDGISGTGEGLTLEEFFHFLFFDEFNGPIKSQVNHDMNAPLSHYFIYTGHNSYLTGNQLSSDCSDVPIIKALQRGVRVIELDLWPNSAKDDIVVVHGRVYPRATRVKSTNFKPHLGWMYGAQMVAFNMQGLGKSLWLMQGMFRANGGCGYVKKPEILMQKLQCDNEFDPTRIMPVKKTLKVKIYMGHGWSLDFSPTHFDMFSPPDFYTKIGFVGMPADIVPVLKKTKVMMDNWFPVWNEEFEFPLTVPELALLQIQVRDKDQGGKYDFAGQTCLPVSEIKLGFRSVPLYDDKGEQFKSVKLLMRFQFE